jgi:hypothetical protein
MANLTGYEKPLSQYKKEELIQIAQKYTVYYQSPSGMGKIGGYYSLTKDQLIDIIGKDSDYIRSKPKQGIDQHIKTTLRRIDILKQKIGNNNDPFYIMTTITNVFGETDITPEVGNYYTFRYAAKTPGLLYDVHPLIATLSIESWGFKGLNFHWNQIRHYTWEEVKTLFYVINNDEIEEMKKIPYTYFTTVPTK